MKPQNTPVSGPSDNDTASRWTSGINLIAGLYLIISPWLYGLGMTTAGAVNSLIFGIIIAVLAIVHLSAIRVTWPSWLNALCGIWVIISPWVYGYGNNAPFMASSVIVGIIVLVLAIWSASASPRPIAH